VWDSRRQREAYDWLEAELTNLRAAFGWSAGEGALGTAAAIAVGADRLGRSVKHFEPIAWAEELIPAARACDHEQLLALLAVAAGCVLCGRVDDGIGYSDAALGLPRDPRYLELPLEASARTSAAIEYAYAGRQAEALEVFREEIAAGHDRHGFARGVLAIALMMVGDQEEASRAAGPLVAEAEAATNPFALASALFAHGFVHRATDPIAARASLTRGLEVARDSGNRFLETMIALNLARVEVEVGSADVALRLLAGAIRANLDAGQFSSMWSNLAVLAGLLVRLSWYEDAAVIAGYAQRPIVTSSFGEFGATLDRLRQELGVEQLERLLADGAAMDRATAVRYAFELIARAETVV